MTLNELAEKIKETLPNATFGEDNDGQILIYTNKKVIDKSEKIHEM